MVQIAEPMFRLILYSIDFKLLQLCNLDIELRGNSSSWVVCLIFSGDHTFTARFRDWITNKTNKGQMKTDFP